MDDGELEYVDSEESTENIPAVYTKERMEKLIGNLEEKLTNDLAQNSSKGTKNLELTNGDNSDFEDMNEKVDQYIECTGLFVEDLLGKYWPEKLYTRLDFQDGEITKWRPLRLAIFMNGSAEDERIWDELRVQYPSMGQIESQRVGEVFVRKAAHVTQGEYNAVQENVYVLVTLILPQVATDRARIQLVDNAVLMAVKAQHELKGEDTTIECYASSLWEFTHLLKMLEFSARKNHIRRIRLLDRLEKWVGLCGRFCPPPSAQNGTKMIAVLDRNKVDALAELSEQEGIRAPSVRDFVRGVSKVMMNKTGLVPGEDILYGLLRRARSLGYTIEVNPKPGWPRRLKYYWTGDLIELRRRQEVRYKLLTELHSKGELKRYHELLPDAKMLLRRLKVAKWKKKLEFWSTILEPLTKMVDTTGPSCSKSSRDPRLRSPSR